jgi:hypothetical protein
MLTIEKSIEFLLSKESDQIIEKKTSILANRSILPIDEINTMDNNVIECFLFYLKDKIPNFENKTDDICLSLIKFLKLKILEKNFIKTLNINFPINKQLYLKSVNNNFNDCFGILFLSKFFNINVIINVNINNYILTDDKPIDKYKPYIILIYHFNENIYLPTFEFGNNNLTFNHEQFSTILTDENTHIVNVNLKNANTKIIYLQKKQIIVNDNTDDSDDSDNVSLIDSDDSIDELDTEVKQLISKTDAQLMKEKKELLLTVIGRLKLYQKGYEKKKKADLVSIIRTYK